MHAGWAPLESGTCHTDGSKRHRLACVVDDLSFKNCGSLLRNCDPGKEKDDEDDQKGE